MGGGLSGKNKPAKKLRKSVGDELDGVGIAEGDGGVVRIGNGSGRT